MSLLVCNRGWRVYWCWQRSNNACFCAIHFSRGCALLLPTNTTAAELFKSLSDCISGKLNWSFCVNICMYRAAATTGRLSGFTTQVKVVASECKSTHCVIHREMLASWKMSPELSNVLQMWLKLSTTLMYVSLTHVCLRSSVRRWTRSTHVFSYTQKWDGFLKVDHWPEFLSYESCSRDFF